MNILMIPEWFPNEEDPQLGIFIQKHIELISKKHAVTVLFVQSKKNLKTKIEVDSNRRDYLFIHAKYRHSSFRIINFFRYSKAVKKAIPLLNQPDFIHLHVTGRNYLIKKLFFKTVPFVITEHWSGYTQNKSLIGRSYTDEAFKTAGKVSTVSDYLKKFLADRFERTDIHITSNLIEKNNTISAPRDYIQIITVADLEDNIKNISGILNALSQLEFKTKTRYLIIGDGKDFQKLLALSKTIKKENLELIFSGRKNNQDTLKAISNSDFLIMNSRVETFSMVCAEAILAGKPVIATRCGGPEEFLNISNSILIPVDDNNALKQAIEKMLVEFGNFDKDQMIKEISEKFSSEKINQQFEKLYLDLLTSKKIKDE